MHIFRTDLNLFVVLERIYTQGSITRAAQQLNLTQSAVSHTLNRLRELLGDPLFERHGNAMMPTPFTRSIIVRVRDCLRTLECTLRETSQFDVESTVKRFTLGILNALESVVLPPVMQYVTKHAPSIDIAAVQHDRHAIESELLTGVLDAVIDVHLSTPESVHRIKLDTDKFAVLCRPDHPRVGQHLDIETYLAEEHVLVTSRRRGYGVEDVELAKLGVRRHVRLRCMHYSVACSVVGQTNLLLTMPKRYAGVLNAMLGNRMLEFPVDASVDLYLYWHANLDADPANAWFRERLGEVFAPAEASTRRRP